MMSVKDGAVKIVVVAMVIAWIAFGAVLYFAGIGFDNPWFYGIAFSAWIASSLRAAHAHIKAVIGTITSMHHEVEKVVKGANASVAYAEEKLKEAKEIIAMLPQAMEKLRHPVEKLQYAEVLPSTDIAAT